MLRLGVMGCLLCECSSCPMVRSLPSIRGCSSGFLILGVLGSGGRRSWLWVAQWICLSEGCMGEPRIGWLLQNFVGGLGALSLVVASGWDDSE